MTKDTNIRVSGVNLRFAEVRDLSEPEENAIRTIMSPDELVRCDRFRHKPSRNCYLITRRLLRTTLTELGGKSPAYWRFGAEKHGRPFLINATDEIANLDFNIAHSSSLICLALRRSGRVGVDIEPVERQVDHELVARQFFNDSEKEQISSLNRDARAPRFLQLWVLKEAWMKADGRGIGAGLQQVVYHFSPDEIPHLKALPEDDPARWEVFLTRQHHHHLALAIPHSTPST